MGRVAPDRRREMISHCISTLDGPFPGQECVRGSVVDPHVPKSGDRGNRSRDDGLALAVRGGRCHVAATRGEINGGSTGTNRDDGMWGYGVVDAGMRSDSGFSCARRDVVHQVVVALDAEPRNLVAHACLLVMRRTVAERAASQRGESTSSRCVGKPISDVDLRHLGARRWWDHGEVDRLERQ